MKNRANNKNFCFMFHTGRSIKIFFIALAVFILSGANNVSAYRVETLKGVPVENDFVLGGGKVELYLAPGEKYAKELAVTNRLGKPMLFKIDIEDFKGSRDPERPVVLLGGEIGPYSLKNYLKPEITEFTLDHGQRMILPVEVNIPPDAEPGGLYGSVLVSAHQPLSEAGQEAENAKGQISLIARLGSLFFVRIKGDAKEEGLLKDFEAEKSFYEKGPINLRILFENNGNVYLKPSGVIEIKNLFGKKVDEMAVDPYFALPDSIKFREIKWDKGLLFGRYTALLSLNRGYGNIVDQKRFTFWVIPWKIFLGILAVLAVLGMILKWVANRFEIRRKT